MRSSGVTAQQAYLLDEGAGQRLLELLRGGITCAVDWWLGLMWHGGHIDAAVWHATCDCGVSGGV